MGKKRLTTPEEMQQKVAELEAEAHAKRERAASAEQRKIAALNEKIARAKAADEAEPILLGARKAPLPKIPRELEDAIIEKARESLRMYGTVMPPREVQYMTKEAECPHCGKIGLIPIEFGFKKYKNASGEEEIRPQSWCRDCRNGKDSHPTRFKR